MEAIQILGCVVLVIGILLIGVEFILPGFGLPGISGTILVVIGIYLTGKNGSERIIVGVVTIVVIAAILVVDLVLFNSKKIKSPIKLDTDLQGKNWLARRVRQRSPTSDLRGRASSTGSSWTSRRRISLTRERNW